MAKSKKIDVIPHKQELTTYKNNIATPYIQLKRKQTALFVGFSALLLISAGILIWILLSLTGVLHNPDVWKFFNTWPRKFFVPTFWVKNPILGTKTAFLGHIWVILGTVVFSHTRRLRLFCTQIPIFLKK